MSDMLEYSSTYKTLDYSSCFPGAIGDIFLEDSPERSFFI